MRTSGQEVEAYLRGKATRLEVHAGNAYIDCPACGARRSMTVALQQERAGVWNCKACGAKGAYRALRSAYGDHDASAHDRRVRRVDTITVGGRWQQQQSEAKPAPAAPQQRRPSPFDWRDDLAASCAARLWTDEGKPVLDYLHSRRLSNDALHEHDIGAFQHGGRWCLTIPVRDASGSIVNVRFRTVPTICPRCGGQGCPPTTRGCNAGLVGKAYFHCPDRPLPLYGAERLPKDTSHPVLVVEGELDVIAAWDYGYRYAVVSGTKGAGAFDDAWLDLLEPYQTIVISYDNDQPGNEGAAKLAEKVGRYRCSRAILPRKDMGDCLQDGVAAEAVASALDAASPMVGLRFSPPSAWADQLEELIRDPSRLRGLPTGSPALDLVLGGWRPGLYIVTGSTSSGKTSFATWCLDEQVRRGVPCMVASFEDRPIGVVQRLIRMELGYDPIAASVDERRKAIASMSARPYFILDHEGQLDGRTCLETIRYARRRYGVRWALIDHFGFLYRSGEDERHDIENLVRDFANVGVQDEVTIVLIAHPNRMPSAQQRRVQITDLKGASAIEQDAHCGIVIERLAPREGAQMLRAMVHVDKVRGNYGQIGASATMYYDAEACVYAHRQDMLPEARRAVATTNEQQRQQALLQPSNEVQHDQPDQAPKQEYSEPF